MKIDRTKYLGGSDAAAIAGLDRYRSIHDVWVEKTSGQTADRPANQAMFWGRTLEAIVRREFIKRTGRKVRPGTVRHPEYPFVRGHVDGIGDSLLEIKVARDGADWGEDGDNSITSIPAYYRAQVAWYCLASGRDRFDYAVLIRGQELRTYLDVPRPDWADDLLAEGVSFWNDHVLAGVPPEIDGSEGAGRMLRKRFPVDDGSELIAAPHQYGLLEKLRELKVKVTDAELEKRLAEQTIQEAMGDASYLLAPGVKISWKRPKDSTTVDWERYAGSLEKIIRAERETLPGLLDGDGYADLDTLRSIYTNTKEASRRFLVHFTDPELREIR